MSYDKTNWQTGDIVTAEKLNKLENGIYDIGESKALVTRYVDDYTDKTAGEIDDAVKAGVTVYLAYDDSTYGDYSYTLLTQFEYNGTETYSAHFGNNLLISQDRNSGLYFVD